MAKTEMKILELIPETLTNQFDFTGTYVDKSGVSHSVTVFDTQYFYDQIRANHECRYMLVPEDEEDTWLAEIFASWKASRSDLYLKQAYAYSLKYNPIENYASHEVMTNDITTHVHGEKIEYEKGSTSTATNTIKTETTPAATTTVTTTPYTSHTNTETPTDTTTQSTQGFNSSAWSNANKTERGGSIINTETWVGTESVTTTHTGKDTVENSGAITTVGSGKDTDTHSGTDTDTRNYTLDKTGNIGVQTAAEMLQREYDGLKQDLARRALYEFLDRYTYICEEVFI